jgi:hypothetical protein
MPASKATIRKLVGKLQRDPGLVDELLNAGDDNKRKQILVNKGHLKKEDKPTRDEIKKEIEILCTTENPPPVGPGGRVVEWVGAVATAAAGAAAAACTGD